MKKTIKALVRAGLALLSGLIYILSLPQVRNLVWGKAMGKGREKVIDAKAKIVKEEEKKRGLFG